MKIKREGNVYEQFNEGDENFFGTQNIGLASFLRLKDLDLKELVEGRDAKGKKSAVFIFNICPEDSFLHAKLDEWNSSEGAVFRDALHHFRRVKKYLKDWFNN